MLDIKLLSIHNSRQYIESQLNAVCSVKEGFSWRQLDYELKCHTVTAEKPEKFPPMPEGSSK